MLNRYFSLTKKWDYLTLKFRQDTTTSPFGVMIGTFSHTMPLSTSITSPKEKKEKENDVRQKKRGEIHDLKHNYEYGGDNTRQELWC